MNLRLTGLASVLALLLDTYTAPPADACGVKLAVKVNRPRRAAARSNTPSRLLLVGSPPKRLEHDLATAGHDVEVASDTSSAKRPSYAVVLVASRDQTAEAHSKFPEATIMVRSGDVTADVRAVESQVGRAPIDTRVASVPIAAGPNQIPIAARPTDAHKEVAAGGPSDSTPTTPTVATVAPKPPTPEPKPPTPEPKPPTPVAEHVATTTKATDELGAAAKPEVHKHAGTLANEVYFTVGSSTVGSKREVDKAARWLKDNADVNAVIEGYADPTGSADANMALSQSRAESVRDLLVAAGVDTSRLEVTAYGDTKLKYGKTDGRNRRVAIEAKK